MKNDTIIKNCQIVNEGCVLDSDVLIRDGRIEKIAPNIDETGKIIDVKPPLKLAQKKSKSKKIGILATNENNRIKLQCDIFNHDGNKIYSAETDFFALILNDASNNDEGRVYGDVSVEKSIYLLKKVGDDYCIED